MILGAEEKMKQDDIQKAETLLLRTWFEFEKEVVNRLPSVVRR